MASAVFLFTVTVSTAPDASGSAVDAVSLLEAAEASASLLLSALSLPQAESPHIMTASASNIPMIRFDPPFDFITVLLLQSF